MIQLDDSQLKEIVEQQQMGLNCYVHRQTGQLLAFPDLNRFPELESENWQADSGGQVESFPEQYWQVPIRSSSQEFALMEQFALEETGEPLRSRLLTVLAQSNPFRHFKATLAYSGAYRQAWFAYRDRQLVAYLIKQ